MPVEMHSEGRPAPSSKVRELIDNPWLIVGTLFFVTAALGLPVLWMSRGFSRFAKIALTIVVLFYTALLFWLVWLVLAWSYSRIIESM